MNEDDLLPETIEEAAVAMLATDVHADIETGVLSRTLRNMEKAISEIAVEVPGSRVVGVAIVIVTSDGVNRNVIFGNDAWSSGGLHGINYGLDRIRDRTNAALEQIGEDDDSDFVSETQHEPAE